MSFPLPNMMYATIAHRPSNASGAPWAEGGIPRPFPLQPDTLCCIPNAIEYDPR